MPKDPDRASVLPLHCHAGTTIGSRCGLGEWLLRDPHTAGEKVLHEAAFQNAELLCLREFKVEPGKTGEVKYESAYASPPHVEIAAKLGLHKVIVTEVTATGFKWKNTGTDNFFDTKDMTYTARGVKAK